MDDKGNIFLSEELSKDLVKLTNTETNEVKVIEKSSLKKLTSITHEQAIMLSSMNRAARRKWLKQNKKK